MECNCKWTEVIIAAVILIWVIWPNMLTLSSYWVVIVAAVALVLHAFTCSKCNACNTCEPEGMKMSAKPKKKKRR